MHQYTPEPFQVSDVVETMQFASKHSVEPVRHQADQRDKVQAQASLALDH